jgi:hypothetical protein
VRGSQPASQPASELGMDGWKGGPNFESDCSSRRAGDREKMKGKRKRQEEARASNDRARVWYLIKSFDFTGARRANKQARRHGKHTHRGRAPTANPLPNPYRSIEPSPRGGSVLLWL